MRALSQNAQDDFRVKAYAGTNGVLLAFDVAEARRPGLLGFAVQAQKGSKPKVWLFNSLTFAGKEHTFPQYHATPSNIAPFQKFRWADYSVDPGTYCQYRVYLVYGTADVPQLGECLDVALTTDNGLPKGQRVLFNRAVAASQAFSRKFPELDQKLSDNKTLPLEEWPDAPKQWLEHGLLALITSFIERAEGPDWSLDVAIYEYELKDIVDAVNAAQARGVKVRVLYHAAVGEEQTAQNEASLAFIPADSKRGRVTQKIFHDKFIVLGRFDGKAEYRPEAVLCGSTNFTANGVYRQANVVHVLDDGAVAGRYEQVFEQIWAAPADVAATREWITANNPIDLNQPLFIGFSPRTGQADLQAFEQIIKGARRDLLFATAFDLPPAILDALLGQPHDAVLRYGVQDTESRISGVHGDRSDDFVAAALLNTGLEGWLNETLKGQKGHLLIHTKAVVTDFTTDSPTLISGSHNLSVPASGGNDENFLIIHGDTDLADRYGLEILRFYEHYRFRYYAKKLALKEVSPLAADDSWSLAYYQPDDLKMLSRLRFSGR